MNGALLSQPPDTGDDDTAPCSPFGKLPEELTRDIFISTCGQTGKLPDTTHSYLRLTLQLVSRSWRQLVIGTRNLWNDLDLKVLNVNPELCRAKSWLKYAGDSHISLKLATSHCSAQSRKAIFSFLSTYHFKALSIKSYPSQTTLLDLADESIKNSLETVISLSLSVAWFHPLPLLSHQHPLSSLKYLTINNVEIDSAYKNLPNAFPWDRLLEVSLHHFRRVETATEILRHCESLTCCTITVMDKESTPVEFAESPIRYLHIREGEGALARSINTPKLESLDVCLFDTAKILARQFKDRLRWLVLQNFEKSVDLRDVLEFMPLLQVLSIIKAIIGQETLDLLAIGDIGAQLQEIAVGVGAEHNSFFDVGELLNMIQARQKMAGESIAFFHSVSFFVFNGWKDITTVDKERANSLGKEYRISISFSELDYTPSVIHI
jgi:hypothetical protein